LFTKANEILQDKNSKMSLLRFYFYSYIIQHSDLHAKNLAVLNIGKENYLFYPLHESCFKGDAIQWHEIWIDKN